MSYPRFTPDFEVLVKVHSLKDARAGNSLRRRAMMMYSSRDRCQAVNVISLRHYPARSDETVETKAGTVHHGPSDVSSNWPMLLLQLPSLPPLP